MSEIIDIAIDVFEKQIQALYTNDFEKFLSFMTPRLQKELTIDIFQKAINLYKQTPIDSNAINRENSIYYSEGESEFIPEKHVKLVLVKSGRTLCHVVNINNNWLIDDIYWRIPNSNEEDLEQKGEIEESESEESREMEKINSLKETIETSNEESKTDYIVKEEEDFIEKEIDEEEESTDE